MRERLAEAWQGRRLVLFFGRRAAEKRIKRTILGATWLFIRPLLDVTIRALVFGGLLGAPSAGLPYFLFFLIGMAIWNLFDRSLFWATRGIELNRGLLRRAYMPRLLLPIGSTSPAIFELVTYTVLLVLGFTGFWIADGESYLEFGTGLLLVPAALALAFMYAIAVGLWTSMLAARARDVRFTMAYVLGFWFFLSPVIVPLADIPSGYRTVVQLNPLTPIVEMFREGLTGRGTVELEFLIGGGAAMALIAVSGLWFFARMESAAVDSM
ncbi:MAG: ABC transporter permease [Solirubrobacterales bacterium]|nr:ABC transporter permease [Solirubrobacterales bacterium]